MEEVSSEHFFESFLLAVRLFQAVAAGGAAFVGLGSLSCCGVYNVPRPGPCCCCGGGRR